MIELLYGPRLRRVQMSSTRRYLPDELLAVAVRSRPPYQLDVDGTRISLPSNETLWLGCQVTAAYHNSMAYNAPSSDGFAEDWAEREARVQSHMEAESSSEGEEYVTSDEDMDYPTEFYI
jgi:hypothetical protein